MTTKTSKPTTHKKIRPLGDRVLVQRVEAEERTAGGILLPESAKEKPKEGKVIALGEGKLLDDGKRAPFTEIKHVGDEYLIMREEDILGIVG
jgi:chaperonin GroES